MTFTSDAEIIYIANGVMRRTLPKSEWTHGAHFAFAVWLLNHASIQADAEIGNFIKKYNEATGVQNTDNDGYHETITKASLRVAKNFVQRANAVPGFLVPGIDGRFYNTVNAIMASSYGQANWVLQYWSKDRLFCSKARHEWVAPDLKELDF